MISLLFRMLRLRRRLLKRTRSRRRSSGFANWKPRRLWRLRPLRGGGGRTRWCWRFWPGALSLLGNVIVERTKAKDDLGLEQAKARYSLVLQAMATNDVTAAQAEYSFLHRRGIAGG